MLGSKQVAELVAMANKIKPTAQIGHGGATDRVVDDLMNYINKHELMKVSILQNCDEDFDDIIEVLEDAKINVVKVIGRTMILYKKNPKLKNSIQLKSN